MAGLKRLGVTWREQFILFVSIGTYLMMKVMGAMLIPILAEWNWTSNIDAVSNGHKQCLRETCLPSVINNCSSSFDCQDDFGITQNSNLSGTTVDQTQNVTMSNETDHGINISESAGNIPRNQSDSDGLGPLVDFRVALLFAVPPLVPIITSPIAGAYGDTVSFNTLLCTALLASTIVTLLFAFSSTFYVILAGQLLQTFAVSCAKPGAFGGVYSVHPPSTPNGKIVLGVLMGSSSFTFFGPALIGILFEYLGQTLTLLCLIPIELCLVVTVFILKLGDSNVSDNNEPQNAKTPTSGGDLGILSGSNHGNNNTTPKDAENCAPGSVHGIRSTSNHDNNNSVPKDVENPTSANDDRITQQTATNNDKMKLCKILLSHKVTILSLTIAVVLLPRSCLQPVLAIWMKSKFGSNAAATGLFWGTGGAADLAAVFISTKFSKHFPKYICLYTALHLTLSSLPFMLLPLAPTPYTAAICFACNIYFTSATRFGATVILSSLAEIKFHNAYGQVIGVGNIGSKLTYLVAPVISVLLFNKVGFETMCFVVGPLSIIGAPFLFFVREKCVLRNRNPPNIHPDLTISVISSPATQLQQ